MYRIDALLKQERKLFHTADLALLWQINNANTLYTTIKRYVQKGILIKIHKGFYTTLPLEKVEPLHLGLGFLHRFAYLSCESILRQKGVIFQASAAITLNSDISKKFTLASHQFLVRQLNEKFLYQTAGLEETENVKIATLERAVADLLYFNPHYHFDNPEAIDWLKVKLIQKRVGYR